MRRCALTASLIWIPVLFMAQASYAESMEQLRAQLPQRVGEWRAEGTDRIFSPETIFEYINGAGEIYRAYNMRACLARRYVHPGRASLVIDIFDMGRGEDAFGVFTHDREGAPLDVGQDGVYRPGWLSFWKGPFYVSVYAEEITPEAEAAVKDLGAVTASLIRSKGVRPDLLEAVPAPGRLSARIRYLHHHVVLNYHFYVSHQNILNLSQNTEALLVPYSRSGAEARLLLVRYPDKGEAERALSSFLTHYLPEARAGGAVRLENGKWSAVMRKGRLLGIVFDAGTRVLAEDLLSELAERVSAGADGL
jgi:hypothetical protein